MVKRIVAIAFIYFCTVCAWVILGTVMNFRTYGEESRGLYRAVGELWGTAQRQTAPTVTYQVITGSAEDAPGTQPAPLRAELEASDIAVDLALEHRRKGLLWYSTYRVQFEATYRVVNTSEKAWRVTFDFPLPAQDAIYDDFRFVIGEETVQEISIDSGTLNKGFDLLPGQSERITVAYTSQGMDEWWYDFGPDVAQVRNFGLVMDTNFSQIDFSQASMSPTAKEETASGWRLTWEYSNLLSGRPISMLMPHRLNPGPWASKITYFAPVSLFLFFFLLFLFTTVRKIKIHPMNYFFLGCAFFSYHLLLAYLVDHISIHLAFWICSLVSILLAVSYMRLVVGTRFALVEAGISQFVYLVLFSYTFFFEGYTGLTISILCILTLFVIMQFTGRVDWETVFQRGAKGVTEEIR